MGGGHVTWLRVDIYLWFRGEALTGLPKHKWQVHIKAREDTSIHLIMDVWNNFASRLGWIAYTVHNQTLGAGSQYEEQIQFTFIIMSLGLNKTDNEAGGQRVSLFSNGAYVLLRVWWTILDSNQSIICKTRWV